MSDFEVPPLLARYHRVPCPSSVSSFASGKIIGAEEAKLFPVPIAEGAGPMPLGPTRKRAEGFLKILQFCYTQYLLCF